MTTPPAQPFASPQSLLLEQQLSVQRLSTYVHACTGRLDDAVALYRWNTAVSGAIWEDLGHLEVMLRNALDRQLRRRHDSRGRTGTWLNDPAGELQVRTRAEITTARDRVRQKGKAVTHDQVMSELSFGFWRYLISRRHQVLWPDLASGFAYAPNRALQTVERPLVRLYDLRNRLAHHQRVFSRPLPALHQDLVQLASWISPVASALIVADSRVGAVLLTRP